jgi:hypothetical protein
MTDPYPDDHQVSQIVTECLFAMRHYSTRTKLTACYNLTERILRLFTVQGDKDWVNELNDQFHEGIRKELQEMGLYDSQNLTAEFGCMGNVKFLDPSQVKFNGEMIPFCDKCKKHKQAVFGKESLIWTCNCPNFPFGPIPHWIKCSERLPTIPKIYWCAYEATELSERCCSFCYWLGDAWEGDPLSVSPKWWYELPGAPKISFLV